VQAGPGSRDGNATARSRVARTTPARVIARSTREHALQQRRAGGGRGEGEEEGTRRAYALSACRWPANFTATEERAARAAPRGWARFHRLTRTRRPAPLPATGYRSGEFARTPRFIEPPPFNSAARCIGGRTIDDRGAEGQREGEGGKRGGGREPAFSSSVTAASRSASAFPRVRTVIRGESRRARSQSRDDQGMCTRAGYDPCHQ